MRYRKLAFACAFTLLAPVAANAADTPKTDAGIAGAKAGTEIEKAVGGSDALSADDMKSAVPATSVGDSARTLASAKVDDMRGNIIGPVRKVTTGTTGKLETVHVNVGGWLGIGERVVALKATDFKYIPTRNILVTNLTKQQVQDMKPVN
ncbi:MAG TPA: hypothetical protein VK629_19645 [Steroidobacteraceae bacterium]|nr:hypothetical protein [Steroidobacteraceae bacterium]